MYRSRSHCPAPGSGSCALVGWQGEGSRGLAREQSGRKALEVRRHGRWARSGVRVGRREWCPHVGRRSIPAAGNHTPAFEQISIGVSSGINLAAPTWRRAIRLYSLLLISLRDCLSCLICSSELKCAREPFGRCGRLNCCLFFCTPFFEGRDAGGPRFGSFHAGAWEGPCVASGSNLGVTTDGGNASGMQAMAARSSACGSRSMERVEYLDVNGIGKSLASLGRVCFYRQSLGTVPRKSVPDDRPRFRISHSTSFLTTRGSMPFHL